VAQQQATLNRSYDDQVQELPLTIRPWTHTLLEDRLKILNIGVSVPASTLDLLSLNEDQYCAYQKITSMVRFSPSTRMGMHFFITGAAGTGKSFLLKQLELWFDAQRLHSLKMAPTGIAALNIDGTTVHSALRIRSRESGYGYESLALSTEESKARLRKVRVIIIDEVSMLEAELLNFIAKLFARLHRQVTPFGPVHVILLGDLMQLPPVSGSQVFKAHCWSTFAPLFLRISQRQATDPLFYEVLNAICMGDVTPAILNLLHDRSIVYPRRDVTLQTTFLVGLRSTAAALNAEMTAMLCDVTHSTYTYVSINFEGETMIRHGESERSFKRHTNYPVLLNISVGAKVMFLNNTLISQHVSNGSIGIVTGFHGVATQHRADLPATWLGVRVAFGTPSGLKVHCRDYLLSTDAHLTCR
jgi:ATP-dependent exoDNAse (exonuclease V) alpha subunit